MLLDGVLEFAAESKRWQREDLEGRLRQAFGYFYPDAVHEGYMPDVVSRWHQAGTVDARVLKEHRFEQPEAVATMGDPHVVYLRYRLVPTNEAIEYRVASFDRETDQWALHVGPEGEGVDGPFAAVSARPAVDDLRELEIRHDLEAVFTFRTQHRTEQAAHQAVRPFLEAWQLDEGLRQAGERPRFQLEPAGSLIVDRAPRPGEEATYVVTGGGSFYVRAAEEPVIVERLPGPPTELVVDQHARTLWQRWERYLNGGDTLPAAAYACLTYVDATFGPDRREAAARLRISRGVLRKIAQLSSRIGDDATARKFDSQARRAHTPEETAFLEMAITTMIRRVAEVAAIGNASGLHEIDRSDLASG